MNSLASSPRSRSNDDARRGPRRRPAQQLVDADRGAIGYDAPGEAVARSPAAGRRVAPGRRAALARIYRATRDRRTSMAHVPDPSPGVSSGPSAPLARALAWIVFLVMAISLVYTGWIALVNYSHIGV
jgi:hypothetical protein